MELPLQISKHGVELSPAAGEISACIMERVFDQLEAPVARVCSAEVPIPYAKQLKDAALPQTPAIVSAARAVLGTQ